MEFLKNLFNSNSKKNKETKNLFIRIAKCSNKNAWYADKVGFVFRVFRDLEFDDVYIIQIEGRSGIFVVPKYDTKIYRTNFLEALFHKQ